MYARWYPQHPSPYTLHPTPHTLPHTHYTRHRTPYTSHPQEQPTPHTVKMEFSFRILWTSPQLGAADVYTIWCPLSGELGT